MDTIVKPKVVRLSLSDGQFLDVKRRLNTGEQQDLFAAMAPFLTAGEKPQLKSQSVMTAKVMAYLIGWSFTDEGEPIPMSPSLSDETRLATLRSLDPDVFREVREAIDAHEEAIEKERDEAKKREGERERIEQFLVVARRCHWTYNDVRALDPWVYEILVDQLLAEDREREQD